MTSLSCVESAAGTWSTWTFAVPKSGRPFPSWMVDADLCRQMTCGLQPAADLSTLLELVRWLDEDPTAGL